MDGPAEGLIGATARGRAARRDAPPIPAFPNRGFLWRRVWRNRNVVIGLLVVGLLAATAISAPWLAPRDPVRNDLTNALRPPRSAGFPLGTDNLGRDILSRVMWGSRISLTVGIIVQTMAVFVGTLLGLLAGFYGGRVDELVSSLTNVMLALPRLLFALGVAGAVCST